MCEGTIVEIGRMWKEPSKEIWTNHQASPDESKNTIQCVCFEFLHQLLETQVIW
jgi:hypothetical protein